MNVIAKIANSTESATKLNDGCKVKRCYVPIVYRVDEKGNVIEKKTLDKKFKKYSDASSYAISLVSKTKKWNAYNVMVVAEVG